MLSSIGEAVRRGLVWLLLRGPAVVFLRLYLQGYRRLRGRPLYRYARITSQLYVGGQHRRHGWDAMQAAGIDAVVNLRRSDDVGQRGIACEHYLHLPTPDNHPLAEADLERGVAFIQQQIDARRTVYVHCGVGVGRAPTLAAAYLISTGMTVDAAWALLRRKRPIIFPLRGQRQAVRAFAEDRSSKTDE